MSAELPFDRDDVVTMMGALFDIRRGVVPIQLLEEDGEEEAAEEDDA